MYATFSELEGVSWPYGTDVFKLIKVASSRSTTSHRSFEEEVNKLTFQTLQYFLKCFQIKDYCYITSGKALSCPPTDQSGRSAQHVHEHRRRREFVVGATSQHFSREQNPALLG